MKVKLPKKIIIPIEYDNRKKHYCLLIPDKKGSKIRIERISLEGIYGFLEDELDDNELDTVSIQFMIPNHFGWELEWTMSGKEFMEIAEIKIN